MTLRKMTYEERLAEIAAVVNGYREAKRTLSGEALRKARERAMYVLTNNLGEAPGLAAAALNNA